MQNYKSDLWGNEISQNPFERPALAATTQRRWYGFFLLLVRITDKRPQEESKFGTRDSNPDQKSQNLSCYRYTSPEYVDHAPRSQLNLAANNARRALAICVCVPFYRRRTSSQVTHRSTTSVQRERFVVAAWAIANFVSYDMVALLVESLTEPLAGK